MKYLILTMMLLLSACATQLQVSEPNSIGMKDGRPMYEAHCRREISKCYSEASEVCKGKFEVIQTDSKNRGLVRVGYGMYGNVSSNSLIYSCN